MKKSYSKPGIIMEEFCLAEAIASCSSKPGGVGSTTGKPGQAGKHECGWNMGNEIIWISKEVGCKTILPDIEINGMCYHNPNKGNTIFGSF